MAYYYQDPNPNAKGQVLRGNQIQRNTQSPTQTPQSEEQKDGTEVKPTRVFTRSTFTDGPMGRFPDTFTFYDLLFEQTAQTENVRQLLQDWALPHVKVGDFNGKEIRRIISLRNFSRGDIRTTSYKMEQYLYAILNPNMELCSTFGSPDGTDVSRTSIMVCAFVGDPRFKKLDAAHIEYAVRLNTPWRQFMKAGVRLINDNNNDANLANHKVTTLYEIFGDSQLEEFIGKKWFNHTDYYFNSAVYPVACGCIPPEQ